MDECDQFCTFSPKICLEKEFIGFIADCMSTHSILLDDNGDGASLFALSITMLMEAFAATHHVIDLFTFSCNPLFQLPVAQPVPSAVGLVPPNFPVSMGIPPPGYGPPPPFIRAGFNASQPPPGK